MTTNRIAGPSTIEVNRANHVNEFRLTRRGFCGSLLLTSAAIVAIDGFSAARAASTCGAGIGDPSMRIDGAESLMPGSSMLFDYPRAGDSAILVRARDGNYHAYCTKCSHLGCSVYFERTLDRLECPCHKGAYDVKSGGVVAGPPKRPLDEIMLQIRGAQVWAVGRRSDEQPLIVD
jgi:Rieske Fe-S protein